MEAIRKFCGYTNGIDVCAEGSKGGLSLSWKEGVDVLENNFGKVIKQGWDLDEKSLPKKLEDLKLKLKNWEKSNSRSRWKTRENLKSRLNHLNREDLDSDILAELTEVKLALNIEADKEELYWEQRARANWLRIGDRNTAFFHNFASQRKKKNLIKKLEDRRGGLVEGDNAINKLATNFFPRSFFFKTTTKL
ncbi:hypothetical protein PVK06_002115 [Gossypium arboreum]|uniref:Reverse transcriptase n=1 Tax=Gossypium arboreum TaxID=29729 RepID=A0ABR0R2W2_GOSAR|nr:hypothetical protein PVK06_002115 [Gossypium arboreum]